MSETKIHVGLEIGSSKTCMVVGETKPDGSVKILGVGETRSAGIRKGEISDYPQARAVVKHALINAEDICNVDINSVMLSVTGSHIEGANNLGTYRLPDEENEVRLDHIEEATEIASDLAIMPNRVYLHQYIGHYRLDGHEHTVSPIGLIGRTLEVDYHIIHGIKSRIQNSLKCVREIPLEVDGVVFAPVAAAQVALEREQKDSGALVIDIGAGTTDYVLYENGAIIASGCIPVGGEHITNDIHLVTHISMSHAEKIKKMEGNASGDRAQSLGRVQVIDDHGFEVEQLERAKLNAIIHTRLKETFELLINRLPEKSLTNIGSGVYLTGGTSKMRGISKLANEMFGLPIYQIQQPHISGIQASFRDPKYTTAVGLIRYAQILDAENESNTRKTFKRIIHSLWPFKKT